MLKYTTYLRSHFANWPRLAIEAKLRIPHRTITLRNGVTLHGLKDLELLSMALEIFDQHCYC